MINYIKKVIVEKLPALPLSGTIDLTYRCNNNCRHCWVRKAPFSEDINSELSLIEIEKIANEASRMACRNWTISGGEPMLRDDFSDIFDMLTHKSISFTLNTNGTLITPPIASLMKRKGVNLVALYGADAETHDFITRNPGSFDAAMQGFAYLKEAGTRFIVQIVPLKDNFHQYKKMIKIAEKLSPNWRVGSSWLYLSTARDLKKNREIIAQRLDPKEVVKINKPEISFEDVSVNEIIDQSCSAVNDNNNLLQCVKAQNSFHIDPYGQITFCEYIKDPSLRFNLRSGSFKQYWEIYMPSLSKKIKINDEYNNNCGACDLAGDCSWCPPVSYLEHGRYTAKVDYLCAIAKEKRKFKKELKKSHRRYFQLAGMTIQVDSDLPFTDNTFIPVLKKFEISEPGEDIIRIRHHFFLPDLSGKDKGKKIYHKPPWTVYRKNNSWIYLENPDTANDDQPTKILALNNSHTKVRIYNYEKINFSQGHFNSLTLISSDQIILARTLADRQAFYLHSCGLDYQGKGFLFVGHSDAGKSTMTKLFGDKAKVLCDDRVIVRKWSKEHRIHGTWSHGEIPEVSPNSAPLRGIFFLNKSDYVRLDKIEDKKIIVKKMLGCIIRPVTTVKWWDKMLKLIENIADEIPCYSLHFDRSKKVIDVLKDM